MRTSGRAGRRGRRAGGLLVAVVAPQVLRGAHAHQFLDALEEPLPGDRQAAARRVNAAVERLIRACPTQYLWGYNRYKRPAGAPPAPGAKVAP